ncbi:hypothetical protein [Nonomuraea phyllanthi]|nr:hypothetical protein [Nonomuraea phyllanthi]
MTMNLLEPYRDGWRLGRTSPPARDGVHPAAVLRRDIDVEVPAGRR